jgi:hypothetical protein
VKTVGIALIFGLCTWIGIRIAAKKTDCLKTQRTMQKELRTFSERIASGSGTLTDAAHDQRMVSELLSVYLDTLSSGESERSASETAAAALLSGKTDREYAEAFLTGLSVASKTDVLKRAEHWIQTLRRSEAESEAESKKANVIRVSGALIGAGIAILLL